MALKNKFNTIKTMYQTALESTESMQGETIESGLQDGVYNKKQSVAKNRNTFYNKDYWHTDLNKTEFKMLEGWINKAGFPEHTKITDTANWYEGRLNGEPIFDIYSSVYHNNSTILYEVRGKNALKELDILLDLMEDIENEQNNIKGKVAIDEIFGINWVQQGSNMANSNVGSGRGNSNTRNVTVYKGKSSKYIGSKAFRNVVKNLFEIQEKSETEISTNNVLKSKKDVGNNQTTGYNKNTDQYRVMWTIEEGIMNDSEVSQFYDLVGEVKRGMKFPKTFDGETIFEIENKIVYADTDYFYPSILKVVEFSDADIEHISYYMEVIEDYEQQGIKSEEYIESIEAMSGQGTVSSTDFVDSKAYRREKNSKGKGSGSGTSNSRSGKNVLKSKPDTTPDESITPPKIRTTAQLKQSAFELDERIRKKLEQQAEKYGEMEKGEMPSRNVTLPKETDAGKVRTFQRTAIEADSVSDEAVREIAEMTKGDVHFLTPWVFYKKR